MSADWQTIRIGDLGKVVTGKTPPTKRPELYGEKYPFITPTDIDDNLMTVKTKRWISDEGYDFQKNLLLPPKTVCYTCIASIGKICITTQPSFTNQQINSITVDHNRVDYRFIFYSLRHYTDKIKVIASGVASPIVNKSMFSDFEIPLPPLPIQRKIAGILSAYDDLIENNSRRIKILEEMARTIYQEWFVKFKFPGHEKVRMVDSPLGKIPEGWLRKYSDYVDFLEGPGLRRWQYREEGIPFLNIRTLIDNDVDFSKVKFIDENEVKQKYAHFLLQPYDHVVSSSGTIGRIVTIQRHHLPLMLNTSIIRMRPKTDALERWQLRHFLKSNYFQSQIRAYAIGAAQVNYGPAHLKQMWIIAPNNNTGRMYEKLVSPIEELNCTLIRRNQILRQTRDLLLPKLISGEIDVEDLDIDVGELAE